MYLLWQLISTDTLAQVLIGLALVSILGLVIVTALGLLDLPMTWRGP